MYKYSTFRVSTGRSHRETTKENNCTCTVKQIVFEFHFQVYHVAKSTMLMAHSNIRTGHPDEY